MVNTIIEAHNMSYIYPDGTSALKNINFKIKEGERAAIIGSNGAGKSTLFSHFNGLLKPTKGQIKIDGSPMSYKKEDLIKIRQKVGIVFQNPDDQLFAPTVGEDVAFGPLNLGISREEVDKRVEESLAKVEMTGLERKAPHHLSGGQKKRVAIAGILAMTPEIIVMDEPTTGLDPKGVGQVLDILFKLNNENMSIIIASHDVEIISQFSNKIFVLHEGQIIKHGPPEEIFNDCTTLKRAHLKPPKAVELLNLLKNDGFDVKSKLTINGAYHEILHLLGTDVYHELLHLIKEDKQHKILHEIGEENYHHLLHILKNNK
ncbi:ATP-binding cassette domain-containing protein [Methanobacterium alcaliphilum]|uniref:ATP-binding cassette domain-containing protein n=1 Tax=Methanobacterium alcaliphilum TaxID=392018 RepID=UPI00200B575A|nr:ATP-binding cassette domain-containing protein [Methanobacterium alcaliphilum]MCK9152183.1 ATP-binding cassette domain-containing protein [Methanobacterium alcaliphilum]